MRVVVDGFPIRVGSAGIGVYTRELVAALVRVAPEHEYYVADFGPRLSPVPTSGDLGERLRALGSSVSTAWKLLPLPARNAITTRQLERLGTDVYVAGNFLGLFGPSFATAITVHDLAHVHAPDDAYPPMARRLAADLKHHVARAHAILTDSSNSRSDVLTWLGADPSKVHVAYPGVSPRFRPVDDAEARRRCQERYRLPRRFLLYVGTIEPRKNLARLLEAFALLAPTVTVDLVLAGRRGWQDSGILRAIEGSPARTRVVLTGHVADDDLPVLYSMAEAFAFPSLHEGFGMPVLEAMACGTPVVTSNASALPEAAGDAAIVVDPRSSQAIADGMRRVLVDRELAESLARRGLARAREFTWDRTARIVWDVLQEIVARRTETAQRGTNT